MDEQLHNVSFTLFQSIYYTYMARERPDIQQIYKTYSKIDPSSQHTLPVVCVSSARSTPTYRRRSSSLVNLRAKRQPVLTPTTPSPTDTEKEGVMMSLEAFTSFLKTAQGQHQTSLNDAVSIIMEYDPLIRRSNDPVGHISLRGFTHYMLCQEASPSPQPHTVTQNMKKPLSNYYIASSHNTYLTGHQLHGESSVNMYTLVRMEHTHTSLVMQT